MLQPVENFLAAVADDFAEPHAAVHVDEECAVLQAGGLGMRDIHERKRLKRKEHILDHMGSTELAANLFRATQTEEKLRRENIKGKEKEPFEKRVKDIQDRIKGLKYLYAAPTHVINSEKEIEDFFEAGVGCAGGY